MNNLIIISALAGFLLLKNSNKRNTPINGNSKSYDIELTPLKGSKYLEDTKQYFLENILGNSYYNDDQKIIIEVTPKSFKEIFWGKRNNQQVRLTRKLCTGIYYLPEIIRKMRLVSITDFDKLKPKQIKAGAIAILTFNICVKIGNSIIDYSIPVLKMKDGNCVYYSLRIK